MKHPPRLAHLSTVKVLVAKLTPVYAAAHQVDEDIAADRLEPALRGRLRAELLDSTWTALRARARRGSDEDVVEKVAESLKDRPLRPGRPAQITPGWSAFLILVDIENGSAGDAARRAMETAQGRRAAQAGLDEVGRYLAAELTRK